MYIVEFLDVDECLLNPCSNGGVCQNIEGSYECECPMSWVGKNCTASKANACAKYTCKIQQTEKQRQIDV